MKQSCFTIQSRFAVPRTMTRATPRVSISVRMLKWLSACSLIFLLSACGGGSDSGAGSDSTGSPSGGSGGAPAGGGTPSLDHPASGFYESSMMIRVSGGRGNFSARIRVVVDPGGGVAIFQNNRLHAQARIAGSQFNAIARGVSETIAGNTCTGNRSYRGSVAGTNARVQGSYRAEFACSGSGNVVQEGTFDLPRTGDHQ